MEKENDSERSKGQSFRLEKQHELAGGPLGIFGEEAKRHDFSIRIVVETVIENLRTHFPELRFYHRKTIPKSEINNKLASIDSALGQVLFVKKSRISPDGGVVEVIDKNGGRRIILVSESKHQGNDVQKIQEGIKQGKNKDKDLMTAGNAIERVYKNIQELRNLMLDEIHFPYVVFFQGSNFATNTFFVNAPDGREVKIAHDSGSLNRIDRVTAGSFGMEINNNYCKNKFVNLSGKSQMLQAASLYFQSDSWKAEDMLKIMWDIALTSLKVLSDSLPWETSNG